MTNPPPYLSPTLWGVIALAGVIAIFYGGRTIVSFFAKKPEETPALGSLSGFAVLSFLSGLVVLSALLTAVILSACLRYNDFIGLNTGDARDVSFSRMIVLYCATVPALAAVGFAVAARMSIKEGNGSVRGKAFYRAGVLLAMLLGSMFLLMS